MSSPEVSKEALAEIRKAVDATLDELEYQLEVIYAEGMAVEPASLRETPELARGVSGIGDFDPREIRSVIAADSLALRGVADRLASGSASSYLDETEMARARNASVRAQKSWDYVRSLDTLPVSGSHGAAADGHVAEHMAGLDKDVSELEKAVVVSEAGSVPVIEPYERESSTLKKVVVVGGIGLAVFIIVNMFRG
jgi:hypothetical protein